MTVLQNQQRGGEFSLLMKERERRLQMGERVLCLKAQNNRSLGLSRVELPKNIKCLMNCEAADILLGIQDQMTMLSKDPSIKIPVSFDKGLQYAKSNSHYKMSETVRSILEPLADLGVSEAELCVIGNVCPETSEEVYALIPSLKERRSRIEGLLRDMVRELGKLKKSK
ncbi:DNA-directed RNA polymerases IV and V subunit 4-like isoform X4 [Prosopis cineraria]|uniref:DNA-directed RNA polymerases IV and V subunit 4-like isoform X4 n=1 Tax=Prosopis cineraria TaxID=364024 RepID=UPI00240F1D9C|nr:DNA-directed RNA polymerases IV and V subunit 4-like isoform X4 [Prosopis cineraria]